MKTPLPPRARAAANALGVMAVIQVSITDIASVFPFCSYSFVYTLTY